MVQPDCSRGKKVSTKTAVLMSTWNGARYLSEQINSLLNQEYKDFELFIRDDGSTDETRSIIIRYEEQDSRIHFVNRNERINLGVQNSFFTLLRTIYNDYPEVEYFSFCDQDDFWLPDKLSVAVKKMVDVGYHEQGKLYYSNKTFTDADLNLLREEHIEFYDDFFEALWPSLASGCTMVIDRALASYALRWTPDFDYYHDAWIYRVGKSIGSTVIFDRHSHILYRQHGDNEVGIAGARMSNGPGYMIKNFIPKIFSKENTRRFQKPMIAIDDHFTEEINEAGNRMWMDALREYPHSWKAKTKLIFSSDMYKRGLLLYAVWCYKIIFGYI